MSQFIVHSIPGSKYGRAVLATLEEKGADYRLAPVDPGALKIEPHILRHPFGRIPVLEHDGFLLYETQAILRYLDRVLPAPPLTPTDAKAAARMDQAMNVNDWYLVQGVSDVIGFERVVKPQVLGQATDEAAVAAVMPQAHTVFNELARLLGKQSHFAGEAVSLADVLLAPQIAFFVNLPEWEPLTAAHANLRRWVERMEARPSMQATTFARVAEMAKAA